MKKYILIAALAAISTLGCTDTGDNEKKESEKDRSSRKEPDDDSAMIMFSNLNLNENKDTLVVHETIRGLKQVRLRNGYPLYSNKFEVDLLKNLLCDTGRPDPVIGIKFFLGGVKKKNHEGNLEKMLLTIMQIKRLKLPLKDNEYEYTYFYADPNVCPEPTPCYLATD